MRSSILFCLFLYTTPTLAAFIEYNNHYYDYTSISSDWITAETEALSLGGHLVSINDAAEQSFLEDTLLTGFFDDQPLWIGLTDVVQEGVFEWVTGEVLSFTKWKSGEPNNSGGDEDYGVFNWEFSRSTGPKGTWNDAPLNGTSGFGGNTDGPHFGIIELTSNPSQIPSSPTIMLFLVGILYVWRLRRLKSNNR